MTEEFFKCDKCGNLPFVWIDGYWFADRLLEGVMFKVSRKNKSFVVEIDPKYDDNYWNGMNKNKWLKEALEFAKDSDSFICPNNEMHVVDNSFYF